MPVHLYWGDDGLALEQAVEALQRQVVDPAWQSFNLSRVDGSDSMAARAALTDVRMAPFGAGGRLLQVLNSPFCSQCPAALVEALERSLDQIPDNCHLLLTSSNKPDARLKSTRLLKQRAHVESFQRPAVWDSGGQRQMVHRVVQAAGLRIDDPGEQALADAVGSDSGRLVQELEKLSLYCGDQPIDAQAVALLVSTSSQTSLQVGDALAAGEIPRALQLLDELLAANEPPLRILAGLTSQIRGWLWVVLLDQSGERDAKAIAAAAGIGNPRRVYVLRKQTRGRSPQLFLALLRQLLDLERALKLGRPPRDAFRDALLPLAGHLP
ncbi:MAG: DNA polymerase III subunit delta [Aphanocapsa feldmannii 277cV]|uniref:DNA polymerase III subunit delta n=1 Tax=Aphanocapsa feldmannii 277cV TaxID=2507553 RepID=A0A524RQK2_9CHRO|nr:MAG: DNA polymerase III subunit delta [Aphanocapsa feldmannii 277cV]